MEKNQFGPKPREDEYQIYKDSKRPVRIHIMPNDTAIGIIEDYSSEFVHLRPSMINHGTYEKDGKSINNVVIEQELPHKIKTINITHIEPLQKEYMEILAQNLNSNSHPPKIILLK